jgi:hypothetical protein
MTRIGGLLVAVALWAGSATLAQEPNAPATVEPPRSQLVEAIESVARELREAQEPSGLDIRDVNAQEGMEKWAFWALVINGFGMLFVGATLALTVRAVRLNSKQILFDNRPWIEITRVEIADSLYLFEDDRFGQTLSMNIQNVGKSIGEIIAAVSVPIETRGLNLRETEKIVSDIRRKVINQSAHMVAFPSRPLNDVRADFIKSHARVNRDKPFMRARNLVIVFYKSLINDDIFWTCCAVTVSTKGGGNPGREANFPDDVTHWFQPEHLHANRIPNTDMAV